MTFALKRVIDKVILKFQRAITHTPVTKTLDGRGDETLTNGTPVVIQAAFLKREWGWRMLPQGEQDESDGYVLANADYTINKNDKITVDSQDFIVKKAVIRYADPANATKVYTFCGLKIEQ